MLIYWNKILYEYRFNIIILKSNSILGNVNALLTVKPIERSCMSVASGLQSNRMDDLKPTVLLFLFLWWCMRMMSMFHRKLSIQRKSAADDVNLYLRHGLNTEQTVTIDDASLSQRSVFQRKNHLSNHRSIVTFSGLIHATL